MRNDVRAVAASLGARIVLARSAEMRVKEPLDITVEISGDVYGS